MYLSTNRGLGFALATDQPSIVRKPGDTYVEQMDPYGDYTGSTGQPGTADLTWWLNANAGKVALGAGAFLLFMAVAKK